MQEVRENLILKKYMDNHGVQEAMNKAVKEALKEHLQAGHKVPIWSNGQVIYVLPKQ